MKKLFLVANWKSNKTGIEANSWLQEIFNFSPQGDYLFQRVAHKGTRFSKPSQFSIFNKKEVIICPPFTLLSEMKALIEKKKLPFKLGAQNISPFGAGAYTGEIHAKQIKEFADYVIIGHSERRNNFGETNEMLAIKVKQAMTVGLTPIFCIQNETTPVPEEVTLVAYEPPTAIGTGNPDTPENTERVAKLVKEKYPYVASILYGGSVTQDNIRSFIEMAHINGVLVGGASLDALKFTALIKNA